MSEQYEAPYTGPRALPGRMEGEHVAEEHLRHIRETWLETSLKNIEPLIPSGHEIVFEGDRRDLNSDGELYQIPLETEEHVDEHGNRTKKFVIAAATASLAGIGIAVLMRGRFSPKAKK